MTPRPSDPLTKTAVGRMIGDELDDRLKRRGRAVEDYGMMVALAIAALYGVGEFLIDIGVVTPPAERRIPWVTLTLCLLCILPKTIGRKTGGQVWLRIADGVASWFSRKEGS